MVDFVDNLGSVFGFSKVIRVKFFDLENSFVIFDKGKMYFMCF